MSISEWASMNGAEIQNPDRDFTGNNREVMKRGVNKALTNV
jgi:hypothetical protein